MAFSAVKKTKANPAALLCCLLACAPLLPLFPQEAADTPAAPPAEAAADTPAEDWEGYAAAADDRGITVTGSPEASQRMAVIGREEIERRRARDLAELLGDALGLGTIRYGGYGNQADITLRGFDSERIAFLVDGVPVNSPQSGDFDISQIDPGSVERIEVIYGGSDTKYNVSGALGGVINIVTVKKQKPGLRLGAELANTAALPGAYLDRNGGAAGPRWEDLLDGQSSRLSAAYGAPLAGGGNLSLGAGAFANRAANHFIFEDFAGKPRRKDHNEVWDAGAQASAVWELPDQTRLIASSLFYYGDKNFPSSGFSRFFGVQRDASFRQNLMIDAPRAFRDDLAAEASLTYYFSRRDYSPPAGAPSRHDQHSLQAINRWSWYPGEKLALRGGLDYRLAYLDSTDMGLRRRHDGGVYLSAEYAPHKRALIIPSVKLVSDGASITPVPKLGLLWNPSDSLTLKNNYFRGFKHPDFEDLYWAGGGGEGNPDLKPEDGWGGDIGADWRFKERARLEGAFFTQYTRDSIHWYAGGGTWRPENVGAALFFGLEGRLRLDLPLSRGPLETISPSLSCHYLKSYLLSYGYTFSSGKRIPYMPEYTLGAALDIAWKSGSLLLSFHYESLRYADTANLSPLEPQFLLNAVANQELGRNLSAFCVMRNLLNRSYESFSGYPMPGLAVTLGIKASFDLPGWGGDWGTGTGD